LQDLFGGIAIPRTDPSLECSNIWQMKRTVSSIISQK
jgi:hypothetical protein